VRFLYWFIAASSFAQQATLPPTTATNESVVKGRVESGGVPVNKVEVALRSLDARGMTYHAISDASGSFSINSVSPGNYDLGADRQGFLHSWLGSVISSQGVIGHRILQVSPGHDVQDLVISLFRFSTIRGRVFDADGDPVAGATVELFSDHDNTRVDASLPTTTDAEGEFKLLEVPPGKWYVAAFPPHPGHRSAEIEADKGMTQRYGWVPLWYPGVVDAAAAVPLQVSPGQSFLNTDFRFQTVPLFSIRGQVRPTGQVRMEDTFVKADPIGTLVGVAPHSSEVSPDGSFSLYGLPVGSYWLTAISGTATGTKAVSVKADVEGVGISLEPSPSLLGAVSVEKTLKTIPPGVSDSLTVLLLSTNDPYGRHQIAPSSVKNGAFEFPQVYPDRYRVSVRQMAEGLYVRALVLNGRTLPSLDLDLTSAGKSRLEVTLGLNSAQVIGVVRDTEGTNVAGTVMLIPEIVGETQQYGVSQSANTTGDGAFHLRNVPPGRYRLIAWEAVADDYLTDTTFTNAYRDRGEMIELQEGETRVTQVTRVSVSEMERVGIGH
jgi:Carboxypeptidase regulatory-like domain